jgi:hypothetical protein
MEFRKTNSKPTSRQGAPSIAATISAIYKPALANRTVFQGTQAESQNKMFIDTSANAEDSINHLLRWALSNLIALRRRNP